MDLQLNWENKECIILYYIRLSKLKFKVTISSIWSCFLRYGKIREESFYLRVYNPFLEMGRKWFFFIKNNPKSSDKSI